MRLPVFALHPTTFFKYTCSSTAAKVLRSRRLRWSHPTVFNDLTEFQRIPQFDPSLQAALESLPLIYVDAVYADSKLNSPRLTPRASELLRFTEQMRASGLARDDALAILRKPPRQPISADEAHTRNLADFTTQHILRNARVFCVTTDAINAVMWEHYAARNTGCVLGFRHLPERSTPLLEAKQIVYSDGLAVLGSAVDFLLYGENDELIRRTKDSIIYTKGLDYAYEREWRVVTWRDEGEGALFGDYPFLPEELESVTFGARISREDEEGVREVVAAGFDHAKLFRIEAKSGTLCRVDAAAILGDV